MLRFTYQFTPRPDTHQGGAVLFATRLLFAAALYSTTRVLLGPPEAVEAVPWPRLGGRSFRTQCIALRGRVQPLSLVNVLMPTKRIKVSGQLLRKLLDAACEQNARITYIANRLFFNRKNIRAAMDL